MIRTVSITTDVTAIGINKHNQLSTKVKKCLTSFFQESSHCLERNSFLGNIGLPKF